MNPLYVETVLEAMQTSRTTVVFREGWSEYALVMSMRSKICTVAWRQLTPLPKRSSASWIWMGKPTPPRNPLPAVNVYVTRGIREGEQAIRIINNTAPTNDHAVAKTYKFSSFRISPSPKLRGGI